MLYSTVSKVLRQKEKYLFPEDRALSPVKRQKGKFPDIDRALSSWVRNSQKQGIPLTDAHIKEKALLFARTVGNPESNQKANSASWLEKFKQKNGIGNGKLLRRASETNISDSGSYSLDSTIASTVGTPNGVSPTSPIEELASPLDISRSKSQESMKAEALDSFLEFHNPDYRSTNSQSTSSLSSTYTDTAPTTFSADGTSPTTPYAFSPETSCTPYLPSQQSRISTPNSNSSAYQQRPRSQTFPLLGIDPSYISPPQSAEPLTPKYGHNSNMPMDSSGDDAMPPPFGSLHCSIPNQELHHRSSAGSMVHGSSISPSSGSSPTSPTPDDARAALHTLLSYFSAPQVVDQDAYMTVVKLTEKVSLQNGLLGPDMMKDSDYNQLAAPKIEHTMSAGC